VVEEEAMYERFGQTKTGAASFRLKYVTVLAQIGGNRYSPGFQMGGIRYEGRVVSWHTGDTSRWGMMPWQAWKRFKQALQMGISESPASKVMFLVHHQEYKLRQCSEVARLTLED